MPRLTTVLPFLITLCFLLVGCRQGEVILAPARMELPPLEARGVIGQDDFQSSGFNRVSDQGLFAPSSVAVSRDGKNIHLYIVDQGNHRVVRHPLGADGKPKGRADLVLGQPTMGRRSTMTDSTNAASLFSPTAVAVGPDGIVAVADGGNNRVLLFKRPDKTGGNAARVLGQEGRFSTRQPNPGGIHARSLHTPMGVAFDLERNHLWVSDTANHRVLRYTAFNENDEADLVLGQDDFSSGFPNGGQATTGVNTLNQPTGLAIGHGRLVVADSGNNRILVYKLDEDGVEPILVLGQQGDFSRNREGFGPFGLTRPTGVSFDKEGHLFVSDTGNNRVLRFPPGMTGEVRPSGVFGQPSGVMGRAGNPDGVSAESLLGPVGLATDHLGGIWVADARNNRVLGYRGEGEAVHLIGQADFGLGETNFPDGTSLAEPRDVSVDFSRVPPRLYIADGANNRVLAFRDFAAALSGKPADFAIGQEDLHRTRPGLMTAPTSVLADGNGGLYISDRDNNRVLWFRDPFQQHEWPDAIIGIPHGAGFPSNASLHRPEGLALDRQGRLYVADTRNHRVLRFPTPLEDPIADMVFGQRNRFDQGSLNAGGLVGPDTLAFPFRMDLSPEGYLAVADTANHRVLLFDPDSTTPDEPIAILGQDGRANTSIDNQGGCGPRSLSGPEAVLFYRGGLLVADTSNCRVLFFPNPLTSDEATRVWGQDGEMDACEVTSAPPSPTNFWFPTGLSHAPGGGFLVTDRDHHRVLHFIP